MGSLVRGIRRKERFTLVRGGDSLRLYVAEISPRKIVISAGDETHPIYLGHSRQYGVGEELVTVTYYDFADGRPRVQIRASDAVFIRRDGVVRREGGATCKTPPAGER